MGAPRTFDHDAAVADAFGVSRTSVIRVCDAAFRARQDAVSSAHQRERVPCPVCGAPRPLSSVYQRRVGCAACVSDRLATSVRPRTLRCSTCGEWKPDADFSAARNRAARRGRHGECKACAAERRRARSAACHESAVADSWCSAGAGLYAAAVPIAPAKIATRIRVHLAVDAPTPEARYFQATGRYPCDD